MCGRNTDEELLPEQHCLLIRQRDHLAPALLTELGRDRQRPAGEVDAVVRQREQLIDPVPGRPCEEDQPERVGGGVGGEELEKADRASKIDAVVALAMAVDRTPSSQNPSVVGWI